MRCVHRILAHPRIKPLTDAVTALRRQRDARRARRANRAQRKSDAMAADQLSAVPIAWSTRAILSMSAAQQKAQRDTLTALIVSHQTLPAMVEGNAELAAFSVAETKRLDAHVEDVLAMRDIFRDEREVRAEIDEREITGDTWVRVGRL